MNLRGGKAPSSARSELRAPSPPERGEGGKSAAAGAAPKPLDPRKPLVVTNHIRRMRFEKGEMTQQELADLVGVTRQTINAIEGAKYIPTLELAIRISRVFGVGVEGVFEVGTG